MKQAFKKLYVTIIAENMELAREAMFEHFGDKFMTVYAEDDFADQPMRYDLLEMCKIEVTDFGSSKLYEIIQ